MIDKIVEWIVIGFLGAVIILWCSANLLYVYLLFNP